MDLFSPLSRNEKHILDKAEELLAKARTLDGDKALESYYKTLEFLSSKQQSFDKYKPNFAMVYVQTGWELLHRSQIKEGLGCFNMALNLDPENPSLWNEKGLAFTGIKQYEDALRAYDRALSLNGQDGGAWANKGDALKALGRPDDAIRAYEESLKHNGGNIDVFNRMLELRPMDAMIHHKKGLALSRAARFEEAVKCFDKALELEPRNTAFLSDKGLALDALGRFGDALKCLDKAVDLRPDADDLWITRGLVLDNNEKYEEALTCYDLILKRDGKSKHAWNLRGLVLTKLNRYEEAVENFSMALSIDDKDIVVWLNKGMARLDDARYDDALECFKKTLELDPNFKDGLVGTGLVELHREQYNEAEETFKAALDKDPRDARTWGHLGDTFMGMGRFESAVEAFDEALALAAHNVEFMKRKADALARLGDYRSVLETLERIIDIGKDDKEVWKVKGDMLVKEEHYEKAVEAYAKAIDKDKGYLEAAEGKRRAEEAHAVAKLECHAREILNFEAVHGKRPTREEAFKDCRVPFEHLEKVLAFLDEDEKMDVERLPKSERQGLENMSLLVIRDCLAPEAGDGSGTAELKNLDLCLITRFFPELSVQKSKRVLSYIRSVAKAQVEIDRSLSPMLEAKVRSVLSLPEDQRSLVSIVLHLNVGVHEAGEVLTVLKALKGEKVRIKGESQPVAVDIGKIEAPAPKMPHAAPTVDAEGEETSQRKVRAPRKKKPKVTEAKPEVTEDEEEEGEPEEELPEEGKPKSPRGKKKFSTMSLKEQMDALGIQVDDGAEAGQVEEAAKAPKRKPRAPAEAEEEEEESGTDEDEVDTKEEVYTPPQTKGAKAVEPLIPGMATKPVGSTPKKEPKPPKIEAEEDQEEAEEPEEKATEEEAEEEETSEEEGSEEEGTEEEEEEEHKAVDEEDERLRSARLKDLEKHRGAWRDTL